MSDEAGRRTQLRFRTAGQVARGAYDDTLGERIMEGNLNAFTNPAIEAGLVHSRALLEFLGLCDKNGTLCNIKKRRRGDVGIEHFKNADRLSKNGRP